MFSEIFAHTAEYMLTIAIKNFLSHTKLFTNFMAESVYKCN